jgi:hypothetical protein
MPPPTESAHPRIQIRSDRVLNRPGLLSAPIHTAGYPLAKGEEGVRGETRWKYSLQTGVVYPDPYLFGPSGSGSILICTDPDTSFIMQKSKKTDEGRLVYVTGCPLNPVLWIRIGFNADPAQFWIPGTKIYP